MMASAAAGQSCRTVQAACLACAHVTEGLTHSHMYTQQMYSCACMYTVSVIYLYIQLSTCTAVHINLRHPMAASGQQSGPKRASTQVWDHALTDSAGRGAAELYCLPKCMRWKLLAHKTSTSFHSPSPQNVTHWGQLDSLSRITLTLVPMSPVFGTPHTPPAVSTTAHEHLPPAAVRSQTHTLHVPGLANTPANTTLLNNTHSTTHMPCRCQLNFKSQTTTHNTPSPQSQKPRSQKPWSQQ
jgi:hypothetical protein